MRTGVLHFSVTVRGPQNREFRGLATTQELARFLADVERRAFKQVSFSVRDRDTSLDIVQDAMLRLSEKYGARPAEELPLLFQRILQNAVRDHYRRQKVRSLWTTLLSSLSPRRDDEDVDPLDTLPGGEAAEGFEDPARRAERMQLLALIEQGVRSLPLRQRQAFLLRYWEDMDVAQTAEIMGCSEGSVKTHCSRATHALATILKSKGVAP